MRLLSDKMLRKESKYTYRVFEGGREFATIEAARDAIRFEESRGGLATGLIVPIHETVTHVYAVEHHVIENHHEKQGIDSMREEYGPYRMPEGERKFYLSVSSEEEVQEFENPTKSSDVVLKLSEMDVVATHEQELKSKFMAEFLPEIAKGILE